MKDFADDNFDKNGRKLSKPVENTVGKEEITRYEHFLLFPQCFQKACFPGVSKGVIVWEWVNSHIAVVVCSFFELGTVSKWRIREWVNLPLTLEQFVMKIEHGKKYDKGYIFMVCCT